MIQSVQLAQHYIASPELHVWRWDADLCAVEWSSGKTIAFRAELERILEALVPIGLPSFSALVLLLAPLRGDLPITPMHFFELRQEVPEADLLYWALLSTLPDLRFAKPLNEVDVMRTLERWQALATVPVERRQGAKQKAQLLAALFEKAALKSSFDLQTSDNIYQGFLYLSASSAKLHWSASAAKAEWLRASRTFFQVLEHFQPDWLAVRLETGLEALPAPAPVELPEAGLRMRQLLLEWLAEAELASLAGLAQNLMATLFLPKPVQTNQDLPIGGVSDLANRGNLDRLLLSELANDEDVLLIRVALQEALYLQHETPPQSPPTARIVLLDTGIRLWGAGRVFATAVALALIANAAPKQPIFVARPADQEVATVDLLSLAGVRQHLSQLTPAPHPGACLSAWLSWARACVANRLATPARTTNPNAVEESWVANPPKLRSTNPAWKLGQQPLPTTSADRPKAYSTTDGFAITPWALTQFTAGKPDSGPIGSAASPSILELVLILAADSWHDPQFRRLFEQHVTQPAFVATVQEDGRFELWAVHGRQHRLLRQAKLDLQPLHEPPKLKTKPMPIHAIGAQAGKSSPPTVLPKTERLPKLFAQDPFPVRLPVPINWKECLFHPNHGIFQITHDRRLVHWFDQKYGPKQLCSALPMGRVRGIRCSRSGMVAVVVANDYERTLHLLIHTPETEKMIPIRVDHIPLTFKDFIIHQDYLYFIHDYNANLVDLYALQIPSGKPGGQLRLPLYTSWLQGRIFANPAQRIYSVLAHDGQQIVLEPIPLAQSVQKRFDNIQMVFEADEPIGFWAFQDDGQLLRLADGQTITLHPAADVTVPPGLGSSEPYSLTNAQQIYYYCWGISSTQDRMYLEVVAQKTTAALWDKWIQTTPREPDERSIDLSGFFYPEWLQAPEWLHTQALKQTRHYRPKWNSSRFYHYLLDVTHQSIVYGRRQGLEPQLPNFYQPRHLRHQFVQVFLTHDNEIILEGRREHFWRFQLHDQGALMSLELISPSLVQRLPLRSQKPFTEYARSAEHHWRLRAAVWPDGSLLLTDSRGMLHFLSSDSQLSEISLVLPGDQRYIAGYASNGLRMGSDYFHGPATRCPAQEFLTVIQQFARSLP